MAPSESQKRASLKWDKENMIVLGCKVKRTQATAFKSYCAERGLTSNTALKDYVLGCIGEGESQQEAIGGPTAAQAGGGGILSSDTLKAAQRAAEATGETVPAFIARAVETQVQRDSASLTLGLNPAEKAPDKKSGA